MKNLKLLANYVFIALAGSVAFFVLNLESYAQEQFAKYDRSKREIEIDLGSAKLKLPNIRKIYLSSQTIGVEQFAGTQIIERGGTGLTSYQIVIQAPANMPADLRAEPVQLEIFVQPDLSKPKDVNVISVSVGLSGILRPESEMVKELKLKQTQAKGKEDAEFYASGSVTTAVGDSPNWTSDFKYERQFSKRGLPFLYAPFVDLKYNSKVKNDTDKLSFGLRISNSFSFKTANQEEEADRPVAARLQELQKINPDFDKTPTYTKARRQFERREYFLYQGSAELESDLDFRVNNLITAQEIYYLVKPKFFSTGKIIFTPMVGTELGYNLKNPINDENNGIARLKAGVTLAIDFENPFGNSLIKNVVWSNNYTRRWFLANEFAFEKDDDGDILLREFGRRPRDQFSSSLELKINDYFGPAITYEWGEVPPLYNKVKHKVKFGLVYSFKRKPLP